MNEFLLILLPGMMYFWVLFIGQGPMQEVLQDKENRVLPRILAAPVSPSQYILSKMTRCFVLCGLALGLLVLASNALFGVSWGPPIAVLGVVGACALSMTGLLAFIYSLVRTREQANVFSSMVLVIMAMVGGGMFPFENLPAFLQAVGQLTPNRWGVRAFQAVARSRPLLESLVPLAHLIALGALGCGAGFKLFQRQLDQGRSR